MTSKITFVSFIKGEGEVPVDSNWGWIIVAASFVVQMLALGFVYSYSVFYNVFVDEFKGSAATTSAVGSLMTGFLFATGLFVGPLCDRIGFRPIVLAGAVPVFLGFMISSAATHIAMLFIFFGVFVGMGCGMCYLPCLTNVSLFFDKKRSFAVGVAVAGSGVGNAAVGPFCRALITALGWRNALRTMAAVWFVLFSLAGIVMRRRVPLVPGHPKRPYRIVDKELLRDPSFQIFGLSLAVCSAGYFTPFTYILAYAKKNGGFNDSDSSSLLTVMGVTSTLGRIIFGKIGDAGFLSRLNLMILAIFIIGAITMLFPLLVKVKGLIYMYTVIFGLFAGAFIATQPVLAAEFWGLQKLGLTIGNMFACNIVGILAGPPLFGMIFDKSNKYDFVFVGCGACMVASSFIFLFVPLGLRAREKRKKAVNTEMAVVDTEAGLSSPTDTGGAATAGVGGGTELTEIELSTPKEKFSEISSPATPAAIIVVPQVNGNANQKPQIFSPSLALTVVEEAGGNAIVSSSNGNPSTTQQVEAPAAVAAASGDQTPIVVPNGFHIGVVVPPAIKNATAVENQPNSNNVTVISSRPLQLPPVLPSIATLQQNGSVQRPANYHGFYEIPPTSSSVTSPGGDSPVIRLPLVSLPHFTPQQGQKQQ